MKTYWLLSKNEDGIDNYPPKCPFTAVFEDMDTLDVGDDIEDGRVSSRTMYSPVSFEDVSKNIVGSPHGSPISKNTPTKHTTDLKTVHSNPSHHISCLQDTDGHIVKDANGDLTASKYIGSPPNCPYSSHSSYSEKRNRQSSLVKRNSIILPTPFNLSTPVKQNNILNNNDKMSCPLAIDEPLSKSEFVKETQESPTKNKEVNQMIKNELRAPPKTSKPTYGEGVKKEGSEKPKSQTCTVL
ncbi:hypothetical protein SNE40_002760 [Patella caerulea]|uniref:Uncharacterized protein n=1 Tax=Patella caerulea TaxID=87958 RepID=A0AAN8KCI5_PATCE